MPPTTHDNPHAGPWSRADVLGVASLAIAVAAGIGAVGTAAQFLLGGSWHLLAASAAGAFASTVHVGLLFVLRRGRRWAEPAMLASAVVTIPVLTVLETDAGALMVLCFGLPYLGTLAFVVSRHPRLFRLLAATLFPVCLVARDALRPMAIFADPIELWACAAAGAVAVWSLSYWFHALMTQLQTALATSETVQTELKAVNDQLVRARDVALEASRAKDRFVANMTHELRTPLNAIVGYTEMMIEDPDADAERRTTDLETIRSASTHLLALVSDILDLARVEAGEPTLDLAPVVVRPLVDALAATARGLAAARQNELRVEVHGDLGSIVTDEVKLRQVLLNLLGNSAKFTERGTIVLRAERRHDDVVFEVIDTGIGIAPPLLESMFERFVQADTSSTRIHGGAGLGLSLARGITEVLGGTIEAESELGRGSTFRVVMPAGELG